MITRRCFVGIPLPPPIAETLQRTVTPWRAAGLRGAWVPARNYHLTLRFLGDLSEDQIGTVVEALARELAQVEAPRLCLRGFGAFPDWRRPAVAWSGLETLAGDLAPAFHGTESAALTAGLAPETRPPHPHVTWLRPRTFQPAGAPRWSEIAAHSFRSDEFMGSTVALWESRRDPGGAAYIPIKEYALA